MEKGIMPSCTCGQLPCICHEENETNILEDYIKGNVKKEKSALDKQVGGNHYKQYKIQPYEFFIANQTPHHKSAIIRRILRYDYETGKGLEDLQKIKHEIDLIIELEGWGKK